MEIISYEFFPNAREFEEWQVDNDFRIMQIFPVPDSFDVKKTDVAACSAHIDIGIVVTYLKKV